MYDLDFSIYDLDYYDRPLKINLPRFYKELLDNQCIHSIYFQMLPWSFWAEQSEFINMLFGRIVNDKILVISEAPLVSMKHVPLTVMRILQMNETPQAHYFPDTLTALELRAYRTLQPIGNGVLPPSLMELTLERLDLGLDLAAVLPRSLTKLNLSMYHRPIRHIPPSVIDLTLGHECTSVIECGQYLQSLVITKAVRTFDSSNIVFQCLTKLVLIDALPEVISSITSSTFPVLADLQVRYHLRSSQTMALSASALPSSLTRLCIPWCELLSPPLDSIDTIEITVRDATPTLSLAILPTSITSLHLRQNFSNSFKVYNQLDAIQVEHLPYALHSLHLSPGIYQVESCFQRAKVESLLARLPNTVTNVTFCSGSTKIIRLTNTILFMVRQKHDFEDHDCNSLLMTGYIKIGDLDGVRY
ncbi:hypothetical protein SAMD00019534_101930 [Acytostelium subglobosum LB1]|uniref:hypothetical protein n=1 Tax=Acytostelium subglobosum LB1 TaxID=1410327 RepID=UPI000644BEC9|nr:hypothetical protein SAMD00019534_101930 [Acytostelium subglobosum LB1]GAM27018.1 hypothetical protein SAMD00019534_101930 [Acytostelium subglobosum LB1]|eukprot:XP_012749898.1 hypothetical protein SAMD00019534_101930 [Acytostelium subglobosum LB1]